MMPALMAMSIQTFSCFGEKHQVKPTGHYLPSKQDKQHTGLALSWVVHGLADRKIWIGLLVKMMVPLLVI